MVTELMGAAVNYEAMTDEERERRAQAAKRIEAAFDGSPAYPGETLEMALEEIRMSEAEDEFSPERAKQAARRLAEWVCGPAAPMTEEQIAEYKRLWQQSGRANRLGAEVCDFCREAKDDCGITYGNRLICLACRERLR